MLKFLCSPKTQNIFVFLVLIATWAYIIGTFGCDFMDKLIAQQEAESAYTLIQTACGGNSAC